MWKNVILLFVVVTMASCGAKKKAASSESNLEAKEVRIGKNQTVGYKSLGNGVASIQLQLFENNTFQFDLNSIQQPEGGGDTIKISEKGTYTSEGNWKTLKFRNPKFSLDAVFDPVYATSDEFKVIDDSTVQINSAKNTITIWGVACERN